MATETSAAIRTAAAAASLAAFARGSMLGLARVTAFSSAVLKASRTSTSAMVNTSMTHSQRSKRAQPPATSASSPMAVSMRKLRCVRHR